MVKRQWTRGRVLGTTVAAAAGVVCVLLVLIALGYLVLPASAPSPVTVASVHWTIDQGRTLAGAGWLGPSEFNYTGANGFPYSVRPGGSFVVTWLFSNFDNRSHSIVNISAANGFAVRSTSPTLPAPVAAAEDDAYLMVTVVVPNEPGADLALNLTVLVT